MKKLLFLFAMFFLFETSMAQGLDPWVGTWTSESWTADDWERSPKDSEGDFIEIRKTQFKLVIRITKNGDQYNVRAKTIKVDDPNYANYYGQISITEMTNNTMWIEWHTEKTPWRENGKIVEYYVSTYYMKLTLNNETLHYSWYKTRVDNYYTDMRYKNQKIYDTSGTDTELDLFNDDW